MKVLSEDKKHACSDTNGTSTRLATFGNSECGSAIDDRMTISIDHQDLP